MNSPRSVPAAESSSSMLTRFTWASVVFGIGVVGTLVFFIVRDSLSGNNAAVAGQPAGQQRQATLFPAASLVEVAVTKVAPVVEPRVSDPAPPPEVPEVTPVTTPPKVVDEPPAPHGAMDAVAQAPAPAVAALAAEDPSSDSAPPAVESSAEVPSKPRKLRQPPQPKPAKYDKRLDGDSPVSTAVVYDTPEGTFQLRLNGKFFGVITPHGTKFTEEDFQGRRWGGLVVIEDDVYFATDGDIYHYQSEPEETFVFIESWFAHWRIGGSLDQYFLLYAPTGGWDPHAEFLGMLDLRVGEDGSPEWHLISYEGRNDLRWVKEMKVDTKRQLLTISFCKPEDPSVVRGKGAKQKYVTLTFDVATETFLPDKENTLAASE